MQPIRPSRKRAGTSTNAIPQDPARRIRLDDSAQSHEDDKSSKANTWLHNQGPSPNMTTTSPISIPTCDDYPSRYIIPPTPCSSPEPQGHPSCQAGLDQFRYTMNLQHNRPGYSSARRRNEFPFPIQPLPKQLQKVRLELTIPEEPEPADFDFDLDIPVPAAQNTSNSNRSPVHSLPTPPRSHPSIPTCFSYSPPSSSYSYPHSPATSTPTPTSTAPSSGLPSLSSTSSATTMYSPTLTSPTSAKTPTTSTNPTTPLTRFTSAANALKLILMANDIGMSPRELEELNEFAVATPMSGSSKRGGRILVRREVQQRREREREGEKEKGGEKSGTCRNGSGGQSVFHRRDECELEACGRHASPPPEGMWRDVMWSRFSDSTVGDGDGDMDIDEDEEMTALEGYIQMAVNANKDDEHDNHTNVTRSSGVVSRPVLGTAGVGRRVRPAELCMKSSVERVEAGVGPLGERVWS